MASLAAGSRGVLKAGVEFLESAMPLYSLNGETASIMTLAPVIPVLTVASVEDGVGQAKALVAGGLYAIEVTLRTPSALAAIREIAKGVPGAVVGAGTIVSVEQIDEAVAAGARFLVSPGARRRSPRPPRNRPCRSCPAARRRRKPWRSGISAFAR